jgi:hypothetical protein
MLESSSLQTWCLESKSAITVFRISVYFIFYGDNAFKEIAEQCCISCTSKNLIVVSVGQSSLLSPQYLQRIVGANDPRYK